MRSCLLAGATLLLAAGHAQAARYGLFVGLNLYQSVSSLQSCVNDAKAFRTALLLDSSRWSAANMTLLTDATATKSAVRTALQGMAANAVSGDVVVYHQSSHGGQNSGADAFVCAYDGNYQDEELASDLARFRSGVTVVCVIDTCYSGGMFMNATTAAGGGAWDFAGCVTRHYEDLLRDTYGITAADAASIAWMTACNYSELSNEIFPHGLFTGHVVNGLACADANGDGSISFGELFGYASPRTALVDATQNPQALNLAALDATVAAQRMPGSSTMQTALDNTALRFVSARGPHADWWRTTTTSHDAVDCAQSGTIGHTQASMLSVEVAGPGTLSFWWRVSSETSCDWLEFYVDEASWASISGTPAWAQKTYRVGPGNHVLSWLYSKDDAGSAYSDCGWVDQVSWTPDGGTASALLADGLDDAFLPVRTGGGGVWTRQTVTKHDGVDAAQSGAIGDTQWSWFTIPVIGPGTLSFWWCASSEADYDFLRFTVDSLERARLSGVTAWQQKVFSVTNGTHTLGWGFSRDYSASGGSDCGWVDQVVWTGDCDTDGDGLTTRWELATGLSPTNASGANGSSGDPDGDGVCNADEYTADTRPRDSNSVLAVTGLALGPGGVLLNWKGGTNATQYLDRRSGMDGADWACVLTNRPPMSVSRAWTDPAGAARSSGLYRIRAIR